jgi:hypothetical protein
LTDDADDPAFEAALEETFEAAVFFFSVPVSARLAWRAAFEAETMVVCLMEEKEMKQRRKKKGDSGVKGLSISGCVHLSTKYMSKLRILRCTESRTYSNLQIQGLISWESLEKSSVNIQLKLKFEAFCV